MHPISLLMLMLRTQVSYSHGDLETPFGTGQVFDSSCILSQCFLEQFGQLGRQVLIFALSIGKLRLRVCNLRICIYQ